MFYDKRLGLKEFEVELIDYFKENSAIQDLTEDEIEAVRVYARSIYYFILNADDSIAEDVEKPTMRYEAKIKRLDEMLEDKLIDDSGYQEIKEKIDKRFGRTRSDFLTWVKRGFEDELDRLNVSDSRKRKLKRQAKGSIELYTQ